MAPILIHEVIYGWLSRVTAIIVSIIVILIFVQHSIHVKQQLKTDELQWTNSLIFSYILILLVFIDIGIWSFLISFNFGITNNFSCQLVSVYGVSMTYVGVKWSLYMLLSFRLGMYPCVN